MRPMKKSALLWLSAAAALSVPADAQRYFARQHLDMERGSTLVTAPVVSDPTPTPVPDPTPTPPSSDPRWIPCGSENDVCVIPGEFGTVRYGVDQSWAQMGIYEDVVCTHGIFGDPAIARAKSCQYDANSIVQPDPKWVTCASNGGYCRVPDHGTATVRYGTRGKYSSATARDSVACSTGVFGDPAVGEAKKCQYDSSTAVPDRSQWIACGVDFGTCSFEGATEVRYGIPDRFIYADVAGEGTHSFYCHPDSFSGRDPAPGIQKTCYVDGRKARLKDILVAG